MEALKQADQKEGRGFPGKISRRLSLAVGALFFFVLLVGGASVLAARAIWQAVHRIDQENQHVRVVEDLHALARHLALEVAQAVQTGRAGDQDLIRRFTEDVDRQLAALLALHERGGEEPAELRKELDLYREMRQTLFRLSDLSEKILKQVAAGRGVDPQDLKAMNRIATSIPIQMQRMREIHQAEADQLIRKSEGRMRFIFWTYLAFLALGSGLIGIGALAFSRQHKRELRAIQEELDRKVRETQALYRVGMEISALLDMDGILNFVVAKARELLGSEAAALCLLDADGCLYLRAASGPVEAFRLDLLQGGVGRARVGIPLVDCPQCGGKGCAGCVLNRPTSPCPSRGVTR